MKLESSEQTREKNYGGTKLESNEETKEKNYGEAKLESNERNQRKKITEKQSQKVVKMKLEQKIMEKLEKILA